jgi:hypothetical protein
MPTTIASGKSAAVFFSELKPRKNGESRGVTSVEIFRNLRGPHSARVREKGQAGMTLFLRNTRFFGKALGILTDQRRFAGFANE